MGKQSVGQVARSSASGYVSARGPRARRQQPRRAIWPLVACLLLTGLLTLQAAYAADGSGRDAQAPEVYFGLIYPQTPDLPTLQQYDAEIGKGMSLVLWYQSWEQDGQQQTFPTAQLEAVREQGAIPVIAWQPESYPGVESEPDFTLAKIAGGTWDGYIDAWARAAKAWGHPFFMRFAAEMNGNWAPWSEATNDNAAGQFVQAWRHVHDIFTAVGATNATWVWAPNVENAATIPLAELWPGSSYVDWAGIDGYNFSSSIPGTPWWSFARVFQGTYDHLLALIPPTMPIMIGETGSVEQGGSKAAWITDALTVQLPQHFQRVQGFVWFDVPDGDIDLRLETSQASLAAFREGIAGPAYQANIYSGLSQSPIPAPEQVRQPTPTPTVTSAPTATPAGALPSTGGPSGLPLPVEVVVGLLVCGAFVGLILRLRAGPRRRKAAARQRVTAEGRDGR